MAVNLTLSLLILLIVLFTRKATEFSIFPTMLLVTTVLRVGAEHFLTRLILTQGSRLGGSLIRAFSTFVVGAGGSEGSWWWDSSIFIVIIAVQGDRDNEGLHAHRGSGRPLHPERPSGEADGHRERVQLRRHKTEEEAVGERTRYSGKLISTVKWRRVRSSYPAP